MRIMKDGSLRSLFIDKSTVRPLDVWMQAENHPTKNFAERFGWHCTYIPVAPHLKPDGRVWVEVLLKGEIERKVRPECQGGCWLLGKGEMKIVRILSDEEVSMYHAG